MKTLLQLLTVLVLIALTGWHLYCAPFAMYLAEFMAGAPWAWIVLGVILLPPFVLIKQAVRKRWGGGDVLLIIISVLPGVWVGIREVGRPNSPIGPWLIPVLIGYILAPLLVGVMCILDDLGDAKLGFRSNREYKGDPTSLY